MSTGVNQSLRHLACPIDHIGSISKDVKRFQERIAQELPGVAYFVG